MKTKKKISIIIAVLALLLAIDIGGANYLVSFAIGRTTSGGASVVPEPVTTDATRTAVRRNIKVISAETEKWKNGMTPEYISLMSDDGLKLAGELYTVEDAGSKWAILIHGYTATRGMMMDYAHMFAQQGYNLLLPDMRGHGDSEGNYIGMGWQDRKDVLKWIDLVASRDPEARIVLQGVSMGGATVLMTSGEDLPQNVKAIVADCGYTSVWDIFSDEMKVLFHLPDFPLLYTADVISQIRAGYGFKEASAMEQVKNSRTPILFIHGSEDNFVHTDMVYKLYDICPAEKDIMVVEAAGHGESYYYAPDAYRQKVFDFLANRV